MMDILTRFRVLSDSGKISFRGLAVYVALTACLVDLSPLALGLAALALVYDMVMTSMESDDLKMMRYRFEAMESRLKSAEEQIAGVQKKMESEITNPEIGALRDTINSMKLAMGFQPKGRT